MIGGIKYIRVVERYRVVDKMLLDHRGYRLSLLTRAFRVNNWTYYIHWLTTIVIMYRISIFPVIVPKVFIAEMKRQRYDRRNGQYILQDPVSFCINGQNPRAKHNSTCPAYEPG